MPDNIPATGDVVIHSSGSHELSRSPFVRFPDRTSAVAQPVGKLNGWRGLAPSALESTFGFQRARAASRCWLASAEQHVNSGGERAQRMVRSLGKSQPQPGGHREGTHLC